MKPALVIFDWAGTLVDFGCRAPLEAFLAAFAAAGLPIDEPTARRPMGAHKREHAREILRYPEVTACVRAARGHAPDEALLEEIYADFSRRLLDCLPAHATPVPGAVETLAWLRARGIPVAATTGYTRPMFDRLAPAAAAAGLAFPDVLCADEVPQSRPAPWACLRLAERFQASPLAHCIKVGDTPADIAEGLNAGMTSLGVSDTGNEVGLALADFAQLSPARRAALVGDARHRLLSVGAHDVLHSVADLPAWLERHP